MTLKRHAVLIVALVALLAPISAQAIVERPAPLDVAAIDFLHQTAPPEPAAPLAETRIGAFGDLAPFERQDEPLLSHALHQAYERACGDGALGDEYVDSSDLYAFTGGDPVNGRDPSGKLDWKCIGQLINCVAKFVNQSELPIGVKRTVGGALGLNKLAAKQVPGAVVMARAAAGDPFARNELAKAAKDGIVSAYNAAADVHRTFQRFLGRELAFTDQVLALEGRGDVVGGSMLASEHYGEHAANTMMAVEGAAGMATFAERGFVKAAVADAQDGGLRLYRSMKVGEAGLPEIGSSARQLGVRSGTDIVPNARGLVEPGTGGMSVTPNDPLGLPQHRRPSPLGGTGKDPVYCIRQDCLGEGLQYRADPNSPRPHGFIEPSWTMSFEEFQRLLAETQSRWIRQ